MSPRVFFGVSAFLAASVCYATPSAVDAEQFDIAGVKLGMSPEFAVAAIAGGLGIDKDSIEFDKFPQQNIITNSKEPKYFTAKTAGASVTVHFEPNIPYDPKNKMAVSMVIYEQSWTPENVAAMKQAAIGKYGPPSNGTVGVSYQWCLQPHSNPGFGCSEFRGPKLELSGVKLQLEDFRYRQALIDHISKSKISEPAF
ncbi:hypothetical protein AKN92_01635 [Thiopseudomonas alkaliphila]|nr:hypothetical protein AKN92_01635 [Thiopseudomonas alkaliphila]